jgi:S1-C subfamily serine protease
MYRSIGAFTLAVVTAAAAGAAEPPRPVDALQDAVAAVIRRAEPSVACVLVTRSPLRSEQADLAKPDHVPESYGSAVVLDDRGLLLTNYHVVRDATAVYVRLAGDRAGFAKVYAGDPRSDLAVLKVDDASAFRPLAPLRLGDGGRVRKGDFVLSLAYPFAAGFHDGSPSASWGIISNVRRRAPTKPVKQGEAEEANYNRSLHQYGTLLQTDARMSPGCSGGALIDLKGDVVGLTSSLAGIYGGETPGGFAVPLDEGMRRVLDVLRRGEEVEYGFLGVRFSRREDQPHPGQGVRIENVVPGSPAAQADLHGGGGLGPADYIRAINGVRVKDQDELFLALGTLLAGSEVRLDVAACASTGRASSTCVRAATRSSPAASRRAS